MGILYIYFLKSSKLTPLQWRAGNLRDTPDYKDGGPSNPILQEFHRINCATFPY